MNAITSSVILPLLMSAALPVVVADDQTPAASEFCLHGKFDLGARLQGLTPAPGEFSTATWCVVTEAASERVLFRARGKSNPDMQGGYTVAYLPPQTVRIVNRDSPPDLEFRPVDIGNEAARYRRIDPVRLVAELASHPEWIISGSDDGWRTVRFPGSPAGVALRIVNGRLSTLRTTADLPLRGTVPVHWNWRWPEDDAPTLRFEVDGEVMFRAEGQRRTLTAAETAALWQTSGGQTAREIPGDAWPARIAMRMETLADGVYFVRGVRTGFSHLVVDTAHGLVVGDAPAGWVELPQIPPADLVPGLGISGLSERFIDFLTDKLPGRPLRAVALTHAHDDHAGGARAFAAAGAEVYAPAAIRPFLESALNRATMPADRFSTAGRQLAVRPVAGRVLLADDRNPVELLAIGPGPHAAASLGMHVAGYFFQSDLHVATSDADAPRPARAATECWFAAWAADNLPPETMVLSSHGSVRTPVARLTLYLDSEQCLPVQ